MIARVVRGPAEGWLSLGLVMLMCVTVAWAIDDAAPVMGRDSFTDFLVWAAVGGVLSGFIGPKVGWGRWRTYLIGSIFAVLLLSLIVGQLLPRTYPGLYGRFEATASAVVNAYFDLVYYRLAFTQEYGHHLLVIGLVVWATSMFAAYAVFGHRRPLNAVVLVGLVLVINMSVTNNEQLGYLVMYSVASMILLIRSHAFEERTEWVRRRIGDPSAISSIYLRGGALFIALAVTGSLLLTFSATSSPLAGAWDGVSSQVLAATRSFGKFLPGGPNTKNFDADFGQDTQIRGYWAGTDALNLTIDLPPGAPKSLYWRAVTFDEFDLNSWRATVPTDTLISAGDPVLAGSSDALPTSLATDTITFTVIPGAYRGPYIVSPLVPDTVNQTTTRTTTGAGANFAGLRRSPSAASYIVTASIPIRDGSRKGGIKANRLREAGDEYPQEIRDLYLPVPERAMDGYATELLAQMLAKVKGGKDANPYDIAESFVKQFQDPTAFQYKADVQYLTCPEERLSTVECFSKYKVGYCQFYASTMAIFMRQLGIPTRLAEGYLPGDRDDRTGIETLLNKDLHEWVEVYFPGYGWVPFDPTGGNVAALPALASGAPPANATPRPSVSHGPITGGTDRVGNERPDGASGSGAGTGKGGSAGVFGALAVLLAVVVGAIAFIVWRRGPRGGTSPDRAYGTVTRIASRLGYGPRPNQTVYEYAGALGDVLPDARPALETVAQAKVESTYGRGSMGPDRLSALREAERRLRVALLRLVFRRGRRTF